MFGSVKPSGNIGGELLGLYKRKNVFVASLLAVLIRNTPVVGNTNLVWIQITLNGGGDYRQQGAQGIRDRRNEWW